VVALGMVAAKVLTVVYFDRKDSFGVVRRIISARRSSRYERADVLEWFRSQGPRYESRMNAVLRTYMAQLRSRGGR
jgi:hypothetical protein